MEYFIFEGRCGISSHSHVHYHSVSAACHSDGHKREEREFSKVLAFNISSTVLDR